MDAFCASEGPFWGEVPGEGIEGIVLLLLVVSIVRVLRGVEVLTMLDGEASKVSLGGVFRVSFWSNRDGFLAIFLAGFHG